MKAVVPVRRAMGVRTAFNILGPLTNPAAPPYLLLGAFSPEMAELMARAVAGSGVRRAWVVHGEPGWDEATPVGEFLVFEAENGEVRQRTRDPAEWGLERCTADDLAGGDARDNAARLAAVLEGREEGPHRDALILGAALVLELTGRSRPGAPAAAAAGRAIEEGRGAALLASLRSG
jgi:anthranilate phosphoribosyltransferase